jgi:hypothetical protein
MERKIATIYNTVIIRDIAFCTFTLIMFTLANIICFISSLLIVISYFLSITLKWDYSVILTYIGGIGFCIVCILCCFYPWIFNGIYFLNSGAMSYKHNSYYRNEGKLYLLYRKLSTYFTK